MSKEDVLTNIEKVLPKLKEYAQFKTVMLTPDERDIIKELAPLIVPDRTYNFSCGSCAGELLTIIYSYWQRNNAAC